MDYRSPFENVFSFINALPQGHNKPVKHAFYNAVALFLLVVCVAVGYALLLILEPFLKPLMWALLVGSVLHPFKRSLTKRLKQWFGSLEEAQTPFVIGLFFMPINIINQAGDFIGNKLQKNLKVIVVISVAVPLVQLIYHYTPKFVINSIIALVDCFLFLVQFFLNNTSSVWILLALIGYISLTYVLWKPENNKKFHIASLGIWFLISCFIAHLSGILFQKAVFILLQITLLVGFIYEINHIRIEKKLSGQQVSFIEALTMAFEDPQKDSGMNASETENSLERSPKKSMDNTNTEKTVQIVESTRKIEDVKQDEKLVDPKARLKQKNLWSLDLFEEVKPLQEETKQAASLPKLSEKKDSIKEETISENLTKPTEIALSKTDNKNKKFLFKRSFSQPQIPPKSFFTSSRMKSINGISRKLINSEQHTSDFYIYLLTWACGIMLLWKNLMLLPILLLPVIIYFTKKLGSYLGLWSWISNYWNHALEVIKNWCCERYDALIPIPIRGLLKVLYKANISVKNNLMESIDSIASCAVILGLLIFLLCASVFIIIQIYAEAIMLVKITSNVINQTVVHNPELQQLLPPSFDETVDSILDNAYQYGREGLSKAVKGIMTDVDPAKSGNLERQVLELWDRIYQRWMTSDDKNGPVVSNDAVFSSWEAFYSDIKKSPEVFNLNGLIEFAKQNIGTFKSLLESLWSILIGNLSLILGSFGTFMSVVLGGGTAVLNFILNVIVFLTTLFYLLSSSGDLYKPVEIMTNISSSSSRFGLALEGAISGVFTASFKMAVFYGMWTWLIHNLFKVKIVYLPSAIAAILGAVPFLGTYLACIPAVLDLWLAQDKVFSAILFAFFQFLPTTIVDTTIYNEIQGGGHPYLTGLAIAGGIFCLGVEGAIIGPLLLCGLYVAVDLSSAFFKESPSNESLNVQSLTRMEDM